MLTTIIRGTLEPLLERHAMTDVDIGARVADDAIGTLMEEIMLAPHDSYHGDD